MFNKDIKNIITHVAIEYKEHVFCLPRPFRHKHVSLALDNILNDSKKIEHEILGFLTRDCVFRKPEEAFEIALLNGELLNPDPSLGYLTSNNIWTAEVPDNSFEYLLPHLRIKLKNDKQLSYFQALNTTLNDIDNKSFN